MSSVRAFKRPREADGESADSRKQARQVADFYSGRSNQSREERENSPIIHLKKLNNWIKSVLIHSYVRRGDSILDLACGKGGDLIKYDKASIGKYVGVDIAAGSIEDARTRYNNKNRQKLNFPAELWEGDCFDVNLERNLREQFDVCSCQFALHYSWSTKDRAERALDNISRLLNPGGYFIGTMPDSNVIVRKLRAANGLEFGNNVYKVSFGPEHNTKAFSKENPFGIQYHFKLEDAVDCPEWLVTFPFFQSLAESYGLELVLRMNFHDFVHKYIKEDHFAELMRRLGALGDKNKTLSAEEWEAAYLYLAFVFRKKEDGHTRHQQQNSRRRPWCPIQPKDIKKLR